MTQQKRRAVDWVSATVDSPTASGQRIECNLGRQNLNDAQTPRKSMSLAPAVLRNPFRQKVDVGGVDEICEVACHSARTPKPTLGDVDNRRRRNS